MYYRRTIQVTLNRLSWEQWGFWMAGGIDFNMPPTVSKIVFGSHAWKAGLRVGDQIIKAGTAYLQGMRHQEVQNIISSYKNKLQMIVVRDSQPVLAVARTTRPGPVRNEIIFEQYSPQKQKAFVYREPKEDKKSGKVSPTKEVKKSTVYQLVKNEDQDWYYPASRQIKTRVSGPKLVRNSSPKPYSPTYFEYTEPQYFSYTPVEPYSEVAVYHVVSEPSTPTSPSVQRFQSSQYTKLTPSQTSTQYASSRGYERPHFSASVGRYKPPNLKLHCSTSLKPVSYVSALQMSPSPTGSPPKTRKARPEVWPPKTSSVRMLPKTGFSPTVVREQGSQGKRFIWPPPKQGYGYMNSNGDDDSDRSPQPFVINQAWNPPDSPLIRPPPFAPQSPPSRRTTDDIWPPPNSINPNQSVFKHVPRPVRRVGKFDDYIKYRSSSGVPPTYRPPPGTQHFLSDDSDN